MLNMSKATFDYCIKTLRKRNIEFTLKSGKKGKRDIHHIMANHGTHIEHLFITII